MMMVTQSVAKGFVVLLAGTGFSAMAAVTSPAVVLAVMASIAALSIPFSWALDEVQQEPER